MDMFNNAVNPCAVHFALVIDASWSVNGFSLHLNEAIRKMFNALKHDPMLAECEVYVTVVVFSSDFQVLLDAVRLAEISEANIPQITGAGVTNPGPALKRAYQSLSENYEYFRRNGMNRKRPMLFFFTDGRTDCGYTNTPDDRDKNEQAKYQAAYDEAAAEIRIAAANNQMTAVACGFGADAKENELKKLTDNVLMIESTQDISRLSLFFSKIIPGTVLDTVSGKIDSYAASIINRYVMPDLFGRREEA